MPTIRYATAEEKVKAIESYHRRYYAENKELIKARALARYDTLHPVESRSPRGRPKAVSI